MKRLILIRHAKSSWADPSQPDKERPLNDRGNEAAASIGKWLKENNQNPDEILLSPAARCQETWRVISTIISIEAAPRIVNHLYNADDAQMLDVLNAAKGNCVVMIGHMPGIGALARALRRDPPPMHDTFNKYPTGATTIFDFRIDDWKQVQHGSGVFVDYMTPREYA